MDRKSARIKAELERYGWRVSKKFKYKKGRPIKVYDKLSGLRYAMDLETARANYPNRLERLEEERLMDMPFNVTEPQVEGHDGFARFYWKHDEQLHPLRRKKGSAEDAHAPMERIRYAYEKYREVRSKITSGRTFTVKFDEGKNKEGFMGVLAAIQDGNKKGYNLRLTVTDLDGHIYYAHGNVTTAAQLLDAFKTTKREQMVDSDSDILNAIEGIASVKFEWYQPNPQAVRQHAGYFPFRNKSDINLTRYGIYNSIEKIVNEPCILTCLRNSGLVTDEKMKYLESCVKTRYILRSQLAKVAPLANVNIRVNIPTEKGSSHDDYVVDKDLPWLKIVLVHNHFMLNESLTNPLFGKGKCNIVRAVNILFEKGLLEPIPDDKLTETFVPKDETNFSLLVRPKIVPDKVLAQKKYTAPKGVGLFGYQPEPEELPMRLQELQDAINKLPLRHPVDVKLYWRASELGQKVLYETGCFDDVYEITG
ncbi:hypothetical protein TVAGG3_0801140, partial [Trichomonas vaginalis G3]|uniref:hypothetical protein n=1 Tax=Trichomonas vaginalis (strain ATCC PRA-98 / G3) TaxID=412133 RepID=UPI0021E52D86